MTYPIRIDSKTYDVRPEKIKEWNESGFSNELKSEIAMNEDFINEWFIEINNK